MDYIAITVIAITITVFIVYKVANDCFGLGLKLKPLILCALCALFISIVLPRIVVGFAGLAGTIGVLAVFAVIFAYFVAYYDEKQEPELSSSTAAAASVHEQVPLAAALSSTFDFEANLAAAAVTVPAIYEEDDHFMSKVNLAEEPLPDNLDELLELAFTYKEQEDFGLVLKYLRAALKRFPESEAAPFLVVEIANILKNKGAYDDAIKVFTDGRNLPGIQSDNLLSHEFTETIAYLRIIRNILLERRLGFIPFHNIPGDVCRDIEAEFREWRNLA